jgi:protein-disulfide isomerase
VEAPTATAAATAAATAGEIPAGVDADGNFYRGDPNAKVKLVEWSDFQCPYCARHATETGPLLDATYVATGKVQHIFRNFPLSFHPNAGPAAAAAYCAGQQDPALFWKMHDWLFANQDAWSSGGDAAAQFREQALALKVDSAKYDACLTASGTAAALDKDLAEGTKLEIAGTPGFYINDWFLGGAYPFEAFQDAIAKAEQGIHPPPTPTPLPEGVAPYDADPKRPGMTFDGSPSRGEPDARLILVGFNDFQCEGCRQAFETIDPLLKTKYIDTGDLRQVFKFYPILAPNAAAASLCALEQGKFWEFHDLLFDKKETWKDGDTAKMVEYGDRLGLDVAKLEECISEGRYQTQVENEGGLAQQLGFAQAPSYVLVDTKMNVGVPIQGTLTPEKFEEAIQQLLNPPTPTPTPAP